MKAFRAYGADGAAITADNPKAAACQFFNEGANCLRPTSRGRTINEMCATSTNQTGETKMNMKQAMELGQKAKAAGYAVRVKNGKVQFVTVVYDNKGKSTVTPHTDWIGYEEAMEIIEQSIPK